MPTRPIKITGSNSSTGSLKLSDHGHTVATPGDTILWQIGRHSGVDSITLIEEKKSSYDIFSRDPEPQGRNWTGEISSTAPGGAEYRYSIYWKASENGPVKKHDPIISIRPSFSPIIRVIKLIIKVFLILFVISLFFWRKKKSSK